MPIKCYSLKIIPIVAVMIFGLAMFDADAQDMTGTDTSPSDKPPSATDSHESDTTSSTDRDTLIDRNAVAEIDENYEPEKHILISLADQMMWIFEDDEIIQRFPVSTGVQGHRTPTGSFRVWNKAHRAYSNRYEVWMLKWMAITPDGMFGMHALQGTSYLRRIGSVASHGCIRLRHEDADWLYEWAKIGTPVEIVHEWDEPQEPELKTSEDFVYHGESGSEYFYW